MSNNTYSLKAILESDLDPTLCKLMLHEIKSPLLEHSFQLTTDDENSFYVSTRERTNDNFENMEDKRNWGKIKSKNNGVSWRDENKKLEDLSMAQSEYEPSKRSSPYSQPKHFNQNDAIYQSSPKEAKHIQYSATSNFVSPLQYFQNSDPSFHLTKEEEKESSSFMFDNKRYENFGAWCGEIFDPTDADKNEVIVDFGGRVQRKKIFQNNKKSELKIANFELKSARNFYIHFKEAIQKLNQIEENEVARFVEFLWKTLHLLQKASPYNEILSQNEEKMNKLLLNENPVDFETRQTITNKNRILNRFKSNKISEVLSTIVSLSKNNPHQNINQLQNSKMEENIAKSLQIYSQIEEVVEDYVSQPYIFSDLDKIYHILYTEEISANSIPPTPISSLQVKTESQSELNIKNYPLPNYSLGEKISKLLLSLKIDPDLFKNIKDLGYIWNDINISNAYSPNSHEKIKIGKEKFMNELCKNDILVNEGYGGRKEMAIEKKLNEMGFTRNLN